MAGKAKIVDGRFEVAPGLVIHPAFRGHTYGSQLLQVHTPRGELVFGSDAYSSWEGIRDWNVANIQQTDTIQQFLAYEKCYVLTSNSASFNNCLAAHERLAYSTDYPITTKLVDHHRRELLAGRRADPGERRAVRTFQPTSRPVQPDHGARPWRQIWALADRPVVCKNTIAAVPPHTICP